MQIVLSELASELLDSWLSAEYLFFVLILKVVLWEVRVNDFAIVRFKKMQTLKIIIKCLQIDYFSGHAKKS